MSLRIIAGQFRGRSLRAPPGLDTRPLPDRIKQSLFDWLGQTCEGLTVVDVCAGSGSFACEAFSRDAKMVHAIESGNHALAALKANIAALGNPANFRLHPRPFEQELGRLRGCDLVFADPPFPWFAERPELISQLLCDARQAMTRAGRLVIRGERGVDLPPLPAGLHEEERRHYGRSWVALLRKQEPGAPPISTVAEIG